MTVEEWWEKVDQNWDDLVSIIKRFHPRKGIRDDKWFPITAPRAEIAASRVRNTIKTENPLGIATQAKTERDVQTLLKILTEAWLGAPESRSVYSVPGFGLMCHLMEGPDDV